ncbi:hypothetical protein [Halorubrum sp. SY-15]|jgi:predicted amidophosphoribosyltransferase|uniref:hypothetical protein n=1 Tax=Halorubrum sp. SY-15 TaxID=3402277 RepID=UPI003EBB770F
MKCPTCQYDLDPASNDKCPRCGYTLRCSTLDCGSCGACGGGSLASLRGLFSRDDE